MKLAIVLTSASRPDFFKLSYNSFNEKLAGGINDELHNDYKVILHEDFCDEKKSKKVVDWCNEKIFVDDIIEPYPRIGLIGSCMNMLDYAKNNECEYVLRLCDDFIFTDSVDIANLINIMDKRKDINQIAFNKRPNNKSKGGFIKKEIEIDGQKLTTALRWSSLNSIWRVDFIYDHWKRCWNGIKETKRQFVPWKEFSESIEKHFNFRREDIDAYFEFNKLGCYLYGGIGDEKSYVNVHIGAGHSRVFEGK